MPYPYLIQVGDNLTSIAQTHSCTVEDLLALNPRYHQNPDFILAGDTLILPTKTPVQLAKALLSYVQAMKPELPDSSLDDPVTRCDQPSLTPCAVKNILIRSGDKNRENYTFDVIATQNKESKAEFSIISAPAGDKAVNKVSFELQGGTCNAGKPSQPGTGQLVDPTSCGNTQTCPRIQISGPGVSADHPAPYKVALPARDIAEQNLLTFARDLILPLADHTRQSYKVGLPVDCYGAQFFNATVHAYPKIAWSGEISLGYGFETLAESHSNWTNTTRNSRERLVRRSGHFTLEGKIKVSHGGSDWEIGAKAEKEKHAPGSPALRGLFDGAQKFLDDFGPLVEDICNRSGHVRGSHAPTLKMRWPKLTLGGKMETVEAPDSHKVLMQGNIDLKFEPLIGAEIKVEILGWLLDMVRRLGSPESRIVANVLLKAKNAAQKGIEFGDSRIQAEIGIDFTMGGEAKGGIGVRYLAGELKECSAMVGGGVDIAIKAYAKTGLKVKTPLLNLTRRQALKVAQKPEQDLR